MRVGLAECDFVNLAKALLFVECSSCARFLFAYLDVVCLRAAAGQAEILNVAVHPSACRKGIGLALFSYVLNALKVQGVQDVTLEVNSKNFPAICLYEKVGFREVGRREKFYHQTDDALIMGKRL